MDFVFRSASPRLASFDGEFGLESDSNLNRTNTVSNCNWNLDRIPIQFALGMESNSNWTPRRFFPSRLNSTSSQMGEEFTISSLRE